MFYELTRNKEHFKNILTIKDGIYVTNKDIFILIPRRHEQINMFKFDKDIVASGVWCICDEAFYTVSKIPGALTLFPEQVTTLNINGTEYYKLHFAKGSNVFRTRVMMVKDSMFGIFEDYLQRGKVPEFLNYRDVIDILVNGAIYADRKFANLEKITELLVSMCTRLKSDKTKFYRHNQNVPLSDTTFVGLMDITYSYNNTAQLTHNYFKNGLNASLSNKAVTKQTTQDYILEGKLK